MQINPTIVFRVELTWREVKLLRRALEMEGGAGVPLAAKITEQIEATRNEMLAQLRKINENTDDL